MATSEAEVLLPIIDRIYESVERPELWPETIDSVGELVSGRRGFWIAPPSDPRDPGITAAREAHTFFFSRTDLRVLDQYAIEFGELVVRFLKVVFLGLLWSPNQAGDHEAIGLRMAQRFLPAFDAPDRTSPAVPSKLAVRNLIAALWEDGRAFTAERLQLLRQLAPHLDRAVRMQMRLIEMELRGNMLCATLDRLALGVVLLDRSGRPVWLNRRAQEIVDEKNGMRLSAMGLAAHDPLDTRRLRELIENVLSTGAQGLLPIRRGEDAKPLLLIAFPLKASGITIDVSSRVAYSVLFISNPDSSSDPNVDAMRQAFNLTYREAQTAVAVARGQGLQSAADAMGVALTTARSQLQQVFAKTGTRHQAELAGLVHRTLGQLRMR